MNRAALVILLLPASMAAAQSKQAGDLVPVEQGISDMSALGTSLRHLPIELGEGNNFMRLFGVAGRPDLLVRSQGGMYAVFEQGNYMTIKDRRATKTYVLWPAGVTFHIGRPDFATLRKPGIRYGPEATMLAAPGITIPQRKIDPNQIDARGDDVREGKPDGDGPIDTRLAESRIDFFPVNDQDRARAKGGIPGYGARNPSEVVVPKEVVVQKDVVAPKVDAPSVNRSPHQADAPVPAAPPADSANAPIHAAPQRP